MAQCALAGFAATGNSGSVFGTRGIVLGVSDLSTLDWPRRAKAAGAPVTAEVTVQHLLLTDEANLTYDTNTKCNPPLRSEAERVACVKGLADGTIDETTPSLSAAALAATHATASQTNPSGSTSEFGPLVAIAALPPVLTNPGPQSATEFVPFTLNPVGSDPDSSPVVWSATGMPTGMTIDPATGAMAWTPGELDGGTSYTIDLSLTGGGVTVTETFVLTVIEDDQPPVVAPIAPGSLITIV